MIPKKSLGQNFLTNPEIAENIVKSAGLSPTDNVLEIGPGKGMLTNYLAKKAGKILAVEIDRELAESLSSVIARSGATKQSRAETENAGLPRYARNDKVRIIEGDILKIDLPKLIEENDFKNYKVVANLPYYITSKIIRLLLETRYPPQEMILMVQKEVGERIVALDGKESLLSISVKFYAEPEILFNVAKENFNPAPEVDSAIIRIKRKKEMPDVDVKKFFSLVRTGFSFKRKMLVNNLRNLGYPRAELLGKLKKIGLEPKVRAEKLKVADWARLCEAMSKCLQPDCRIKHKKEN